MTTTQPLIASALGVRTKKHQDPLHKAGSFREGAPARGVAGGTACEVRASTAGFEMGCPGNLPLKLTEFPDPQGVGLFRLPDLSVAVPDELAGIVDVGEGT